MISRWLILLMVICLFPGVAWTASPEEEHSANHQCRVDADREIAQLQSSEREYNKKQKKGELTISDLLEGSHYSQTIKVCMIIVKTESRMVGKENANPFVPLTVDFTLKSLFEETEYGKYNRVFVEGDPTKYMKCYVKDISNGKKKNCLNKDEWDDLIKPYMEK